MATKKPKAPKAPKESASLAVWENYKQRLLEWKKKCAQIDADARHKASIIKQTKAAKTSRSASISGFGPKRRKKSAAVSGTKKKAAPKKAAKRRR